MKPLPIKTKLILWYLSVMIILMILFAAGLYFSLKISLTSNLDLRLTTFGREIRQDAADNPRKSWERVVNEEHEEFEPKAIYIQVVQLLPGKIGFKVIAKNKVLGKKTLPLTKKAYYAVLKNEIYSEDIDNDVFEEDLRLISFPPVNRHGKKYVIQIAKSIRLINNPLRRLFVILAFAVPLLLLFLTIGGYLFIKKTLKPVKKIVDSVKEISAEDFAHLVEYPPVNDEIGELADTFNDMIRRLERSFMRIKQFSSDVSHELKTPLTAIRGEMEVALRKERTKEEYEKVLKSVLEEMAKLNNIIDNLLFLTRLDSREGGIALYQVSADEILLDVFERFEVYAKAKNIALVLRKISPIKIKSDELLLARLFRNLIENSLKYTLAGGRVDVSLEKRDNAVVFSVSDNGIGIPQEALSFIFDRFYRVDSARAQTEFPGTGLGLSIVKWIAESLGGKIEVQSKLEEGSTFTAIFPL